MLTARDVAERLKCHPDTARDLMRRLPHYEIGSGERKMIRVDENTLEQYIAGCRVVPMIVLPTRKTTRIARR